MNDVLIHQKWAEILLRALEERPTRKTYYKSPNSATLKRNNDISLSLLKSLCGGKWQNEFCKIALLIIKSYESISVN